MTLTTNAELLREGWHWPPRAARPFSARQAELMRAIMAGATTYSDMAAALHLSQRTVQTMLYSMYAKTGAHNVADLVLWKIARSEP